MNEVDFLRGIEGEEQNGTDLVSGAEHLVRLKIQSGQETQPKYEDLELKKEAKIFGTHAPHTLEHAAIPEKTRQKQYKEYVNEKSKEEPTGYLKGTAGGALLGGGLGGGLGALLAASHGMPIGPSLRTGAIGGSIVGGIGGLGAAAADKHNIETSRDVVSNNDYENGFANHIADTMDDHQRQQWWTDERRHQQLLHKRASLKDTAKTVLEGAKSGLKYQSFGAGAGVAGMKADKARSVGHLLGMAAPAAAVGAAGYAAGHHAGQRAGLEKDADLSESIGSAAMCKGCGKVKEACGCGTKMAAAEVLKTALREKLATPKDWNKSMLAATTGLGALAGGLGTFLASRAQKDTGKSKMEENLGAAVEANKSKPERGFLHKIKNRETESAHGLAQVFREHPVKASLLGSITGAASGYGLGQLGGAIARRGGK